MSSTIGKVVGLFAGDSVGYDKGTVRILEDNGMESVFILWQYAAGEGPTAFDSVRHSIWVSLLRDALLHDKSVVIYTDEDSGLASSVTLNAN